MKKLSIEEKIRRQEEKLQAAERLIKEKEEQVKKIRQEIEELRIEKNKAWVNRLAKHLGDEVDLSSVSFEDVLHFLKDKTKEHNNGDIEESVPEDAMEIEAEKIQDALKEVTDENSKKEETMLKANEDIWANVKPI